MPWPSCAHRADAAFPEVDLADVHIRLVELAPALLAPFHPSCSEYARAAAAPPAAWTCTWTPRSRRSADQVILANGDKLPSDVTVWAAGVSAPARGGRAGACRRAAAAASRSARTCGSRGQDRIFAPGDIALIEGQPLPQLAQPAIQTGRHAARQIRRLRRRQPATPFHYHDKGIMATIGRRSRGGRAAHRIRVRGTLAWLAWLALHLFTLLGDRNRLSALLNLSWRYLVWGHGGGVIVGDDPPLVGPGGPPPVRPSAVRWTARCRVPADSRALPDWSAAAADDEACVQPLSAAAARRRRPTPAEEVRRARWCCAGCTPTTRARSPRRWARA